MGTCPCPAHAVGGCRTPKDGFGYVGSSERLRLTIRTHPKRKYRVAWELPSYITEFTQLETSGITLCFLLDHTSFPVARNPVPACAQGKVAMPGLTKANGTLSRMLFLLLQVCVLHINALKLLLCFPPPPCQNAHFSI